MRETSIIKAVGMNVKFTGRSRDHLPILEEQLVALYVK